MIFAPAGKKISVMLVVGNKVVYKKMKKVPTL